jgi:hypothetical protein
MLNSGDHGAEGFLPADGAELSSWDEILLTAGHLLSVLPVPAERALILRWIARLIPALAVMLR